MDDRQWMVTTALGGIFASAFLYLPFIGGLWAFLAVAVLQGLYLGWQDVPTTQLRLGMLAFAVGLYLGVGLLGALLTSSGPGNLWGLVGLMGMGAGLVAMFASRMIRNARK